MYFVPCDNWNLLLLINVYRHSDVFSTAPFCCFLQSKCLREVRISCFNKQCNANIKAPKYSCSISYFLNFVFVIVPNFSSEMKFLKKTQNRSRSTFFIIRFYDSYALTLNVPIPDKVKKLS